MANLIVRPTVVLELSSEEFVLISKGLDTLTTVDGDKLPRAQRLRDDITRARATQMGELAKQITPVLAKLPPKDHDYGDSE